MTFTRTIGNACNKVIRLIVRGLALSKIHPNVLTFHRPADQYLARPSLLAIGTVSLRPAS